MINITFLAWLINRIMEENNTSLEGAHIFIRNMNIFTVLKYFEIYQTTEGMK